MTSLGFELSIAQAQALGRYPDAAERWTVAKLIPSGVGTSDLADRLHAAMITYDILRTRFVQPIGLSAVLQSVADAPEQQDVDRLAGDLESAVAAECAATTSESGIRAVLARVGAHFGVDLPLHVIFESSTIATMAADIDERVAGNAARDSDVSDLLDYLDSLTEEEAARLLQSEGAQSSDS